MKHNPLTIGVYTYNGMDLLDATGPIEVFTYAAHQTPQGRERGIQIDTIADTKEPIQTYSGVTIVPTTSIKHAPLYDVLILPGAPESELIQAVSNKQTQTWITKQAQGNQYTTSVCTGVYFLAYAGLLNGKKATTHHKSCDFLATHFPAIHVQTHKRFVVDQTIITSGGVTSGIDMALYLVETFLGQAAADRVKDGIEFNP
ncbi:DJ-1/PfpI family protein [Hazenella sp. IB182357]|uniref:DJ-1/PfpI family protein n=1 Tax=Polycladospora coralii TaxID=2771432 RepID=A0A926N876_9BACL|nr:DJ-1/PfpI family protein [Polycladospora coralii]MBD1371542.1 DJ-1/PfpI family protein [Polycladospora coralii]